jgi:hypothetical protein
MAAGHSHQPADGDGGADWFKVLDIAVWVAVVLLVVMAAEWVAGRIVRERIARGAARHLAKAAPATP